MLFRSKTAKQWINVLEASFIIKILNPFYKNLNKRFTKSPKLYFLDIGLVCYLLSIKNPQQLQAHPLFGSLFETYVVSEVLKSYFNNIEEPPLYYYRDLRGQEIDLIFDHITHINQIEIKSSQTYQKSFTKGLTYLKKSNYIIQKSGLIYGGNNSQKLNNLHLFSWRNIADILF